ncbi:MAG: OsmC family protein [Candidatus Heimdallarchaeaceae archaeon]
MSKENEHVHKISLQKLEKFKFAVDFGKETIPQLLMDESKEVPGGEDQGPNASMLLAAAVGNCLSASLTFCLMKKKVPLYDLKTEVTYKRGRNEEGYWRIKEIDVILRPEIDDPNNPNFKRCSEIFVNYCVVSASIKNAITLNINIKPIIHKEK